MILADTSVWIQHLRYGYPALVERLTGAEIASHPFVLGELACGRLQNRKTILHLLQTLPKTATAEHEEVLHFIETHKLSGLGLGYIDMHLLASAFLSQTLLWTLDKKLGQAATRLHKAFAP